MNNKKAFSKFDAHKEFRFYESELYQWQSKQMSGAEKIMMDNFYELIFQTQESEIVIEPNPFNL